MRQFQTRLPKGKIVRDRYIIEDLLGQGGFGAVYRVRDRRVKGNVFALKEVESPERHQRESVLFEGEVLRRLDHRALPRVYRVFEEPKSNRVCILMDYVAGPNLEKLRLQQPDKRFPLSQVVHMMAPIVDALTYLHMQQPPIIHRDVKPSNIIVPTSGEDAVLVDFGIAKEYDEDSTTTAIRHCSPGYGAPEQYVSGTATQTDVYGLGATLYTLLSGVVPIDALYRITRMSVNRADPLIPVHEVLESIPIAISEAIKRALAINNNDRFATVDELWLILQSVADEIAARESANVAMPPPQVQAGHQDKIILNEGVVLATEQLAETPRSLLDVSSANFIEGTPHTTAAVSQLHAEEKMHEAQTLSQLSASSIKRWSRVHNSRYVLLALVFLVLLGSGIGAAAWVKSRPPTVVPVSTPGVAYKPTTQSTVRAHGESSSTATVHKQATPVPTAVPKSTPTTNLAPAPTTVPATSLPSTGVSTLAATYNGTAHNTPASVDACMTLSQVTQNGTAISGYLSFCTGLSGNGNFTGTVTGNSIQFSVPSSSTLLPLSFRGQIQSDGSMSGSYCSYQTNGDCDPSSGYGTWNVSPVGFGYHQPSTGVLASFDQSPLFLRKHTSII
jgi:serine/threonine protein kinase